MHAPMARTVLAPFHDLPLLQLRNDELSEEPMTDQTRQPSVQHLEDFDGH